MFSRLKILDITSDFEWAVEATHHLSVEAGLFVLDIQSAGPVNDLMGKVAHFGPDAVPAEVSLVLQGGVEGQDVDLVGVKPCLQNLGALGPLILDHCLCFPEG